MIRKIVSGAQTGVDRAALDAAMALGVASGGWCPEGRKAEDGIIAEKYAVRELAGGGYQQRTKMNVLDSDGTLIIYFAYPRGGTEQTLLFCIKEKRPYVLVDVEAICAVQACEKVGEFIKENAISALNVAGPRASGEPRAYDYTFQLVQLVLGSQLEQNSNEH